MGPGRAYVNRKISDANTDIYIYIYVCVCVCVCMCTHTHTHGSMFAHMYVCICMCVCVCIYIYIYREREREREIGAPTPRNAVRLENLMQRIRSLSIKSQHSVKPGSSSPCTQEFASCPYPLPAISSYGLPSRSI